MRSLTSLALLLCLVVGAASACLAQDKADFYTNGKFNQEAAKKAYFAMMEKFNYPITDNLRKNMWVVDFGLGKFPEVGMAGILWINSKKGNYMGHEIFLLPNQLLPEHYHVRTKDAAPKNEGWLLRYGSDTLLGEGKPTPGIEKIIPASERKNVTQRHAKALKPGETGELSRPLSRHSQIAGPEGAIVTEFATYHDGKAVKFTNKKIKF